MATPLEYRFVIDALGLDTLPMARLAAYMAELARLLGEPDHVRFARIEAGSVALVSRVDEVAAPTIAARVEQVRAGHGAGEAMKAFEALDAMLAQDEATGSLQVPGDAPPVTFPGRTRPRPSVYGPFRERGSLDGVVVRLGGKGTTIPVLLQDGQAQYHCQTSRELSKALSRHYLAGTIRVHGNGKWLRDADGAWRLLQFDIEHFEPLDDAPLGEVIDRLRAVEGGRWGDMPDALDDALRLRGGGDGH